MKKFIAIVAFVAAMFVAGNAQAQLSVRFGYAPETSTSKYNSATTTQNYNGFFVGVHNNFMLKSGLGLTLGVQGRMNMRTEKETIGTVTNTTKDRQFLLDVPVALNYTIAFGPNVKVTPFVGPMVSFGLSGKTVASQHGGITGLDFEETLDWYGDDAMLKRLNLSVMGGVNLKYIRMNLFAGYQMGLLDIDTFNDTTTKTSGFFVGLGYDL